jgi:hypothetical protein
MKGLFNKGLLLIILLLASCAGPISPFGVMPGKEAPVVFEVVEDSESKRSPASINGDLFIDQPEMIFHRPYSFRAQYFHTQPEQYKFVLYNNGMILDPKWFEDVKFSTNTSFIEIKIKDTFLNPRKVHYLSLGVMDKNSNIIAKHGFSKPYCPIDTILPISSWSNFEVPHHLKTLFLDLAFETRSNPSLMASLVAQESSFDPNAISWAKAIVLTQVTNIAAQEIKEKISSWPEDKRTKEMNYIELKYLIATGQITSKHDWRLDTKKSLIGRVYYLHHLNDYWNRPENKKILNSLKSYTRKEEVILASYNSGVSRVKYQIKCHGDRWLASNKLKEARNYVHSILSYCHDFSTNKRRNQ